MYELLTRREAYLFFLAVGGDVGELPEPLTSAECFLHNACLDKAAKELAAIAADVETADNSSGDGAMYDGVAGDNDSTSGEGQVKDELPHNGGSETEV